MKVIFAFRLVEEDVTVPSRPIIFDKLPQIQRFIPNPDAEGYTLSWGGYLHRMNDFIPKLTGMRITEDLSGIDCLPGRLMKKPAHPDFLSQLPIQRRHKPSSY
jgi:hypothetical protein